MLEEIVRIRFAQFRRRKRDRGDKEGKLTETEKKGGVRIGEMNDKYIFS